MNLLPCVELLTYLTCVHIIVIKLFNGKLHKQKSFVAIPIIFICVVFVLLSSNTPIEDAVTVSITPLIFIIPLITICNVKKVKVLYVSLLYYGVSITLVAAVKWIMQVFTTAILARTIVDIFLHIFLLVICLVFSFNSVFYKAKRHIDFISMKLKLFLLISVWLSDAFAFFIYSYAVNVPRTIHLALAEWAAAAIIIFVGILWPFILVGNSLNVSYKAAISQLDEQIQAQVKQYEFVVQANNDIRRFRHDFENIRLGLVGHLQNSDVNGALELLDRCEQTVQNDDYISYMTGNLIADALLSEKRMNAKSILADILFEGKIPRSGVSSFDICIILGNLLDNAIEACSAIGIENRATIRISTVMNNGFWILIITNPIAKKVKIGSKIIPTSKKDIENHGIGLLSIQNAIQKYNGKMNLSCLDDMFTAEVVLDLNEHN
ncbi:MAG: GHKL domain-containing protein [Eubacterium sp.]|jgi:hypothetical protein|nr:GHKL domain-containing protein [Eubacterium sp.]